jgi:speckle-type POZ protein
LALGEAWFSCSVRHGFPDFISSKFLEASEYLVDECYKIRCDVTVWKGCATESKPDPPPPPDLHRHLGDLLLSKEGADVTFHVASRTFSTHMECCRSPLAGAEGDALWHGSRRR